MSIEEAGKYVLSLGEMVTADQFSHGWFCQLVAGGYPWSVIPGWKADLYNDALEKACTMGNIHDLAHLVAESIYRKDITVDSEE